MKVHKCVEVVLESIEEKEALSKEFPDHLFETRLVEGRNGRLVIVKIPFEFYKRAKKVCENIRRKDEKKRN